MADTYPSFPSVEGSTTAHGLSSLAFSTAQVLIILRPVAAHRFSSVGGTHRTLAQRWA